MKHHMMTLKGGVEGELRVPASLLQETVAALVEGARQATRFAVEGESSRRGPRPAWLDGACSIDITGLTAGSAVLALDAPTLAEADAEKFGDMQPSLFQEDRDSIRDLTAVDLFGSVLAKVVEGSADDVLADRALLETCARFARAVESSGFVGIELGGLDGREEPLFVGPEHAPQIELLRDETPPPQAVRVSATLDTISVSRSDITLIMKDGAKVPARLEEHDAGALKALWGQPVVVSGMARYRPSGRLLMVDVESIRGAEASDTLFEVMPVARSRMPVAESVPQGDEDGVSAFFGTWPGEETEDELLVALRAIG